MADTSEQSSTELTFKIKAGSNGNHTITMPESATVLDVKTKLAGEEFENIPVDRQRLIYSGRVMKNEDQLSVYKIKQNNTVHLVKSAASNPTPSTGGSAQAPPAAAPVNMASGTANNPLAGLTGARFAGHGVNMPGMDMFGPDGGMGPPMNEEAMERMLSDPNTQSAFNEVLNNPDMVNHLIESNPMLRNVPNAREILTSPMMRQMMSNPQMMTQMMRMRREMTGGGAGSFPMPGATDTTPGAGADAGAGNTGSGAAANPAFNPFMPPWMQGGGGMGMGGGDANSNPMLSMLQAMQGGQGAGAGTQAAQGATGTTGENRAAGQESGTTETGGSGNAPNPLADNPFAALFGGQPPAGGAGAMGNPFSPEAMQQMMQMMGGGGGGGGMGGGAPNPPDNRPPEERYADQLRQLNDMGFFDFDRNVAALRRSGGSVQGAVNELLGALD